MAPKLKETADVWILSTVLLFSAAHSSTLFSQIVLSLLAAIALLIDLVYLHAPYPLLSIFGALVASIIPIYPSQSRSSISSSLVYISNTPWFIVELTIGIILFANFIRFAIFKPMYDNAAARQVVTPIATEAAPASVYHTQPQAQSAPSSSPNTSHPPVSSPSSSSPTPAHASASKPALDSVLLRNSVQKSIATNSQNTAHEEPTDISHGKALKRTAIGSSSNAEKTTGTPTKSYVKPVRRKQATSSQMLAFKIYSQEKEDERTQQEVYQNQQAELQAQAATRIAERRQREAERDNLQAQIREASDGVTKAKQVLTAAMAEANAAREARRRASDQHLLKPTPESENLLDEQCADSAKKEQIEQSALNDLNAAQARLHDLRNQLDRFSTRT